MAVMVYNQGADWNQEIYDTLIARVIPDPSNPPPGLVVHVSTLPAGGGLQVVDVWESQEAWDTFLQNTLIPAAQEHGAPPFDTTITDVHNMIIA